MVKKEIKKVFVGLSGGVDSSVSALLLKKEGYSVTGVYMKNWSDPEDLKTGVCTWISDKRDAMRVAAQLDIPFRVFDFEKEYRKGVVDYLFKEYQAGRTPNPDIMCNKLIKFNLFLKKSIAMGADAIATGHYAHVLEKNGLFHLNIPKDKHKDQTYFLYTLTQFQLKHVIFPLAKYEKNEVRKIATENNLITAQKKDSQGICFIGEIPIKEFLSKKFPVRVGKVIDGHGTVVGEHHGAYFYTIGQRHGFTIYNTSTQSQPRYVVSKNVKKNILVVAQGHSSKILREKTAIVHKIHWISGQTPMLPLKCKARIRHGQEPQSITLIKNKNNYLIEFNKYQYGLASGQSLVLYKKGTCLGGGIMK